jgi:[ribosomal protein S5]-alanine N-acetyltransferase
MTDLKNMIELESDPEIMKFTPSRLPQSSAQTEKTLRLAVSRNKEREPLGIWAVELKSTGEFVGWFMLILTAWEVPELGFMIVRRHWRKGLTTEVGERLLKYAFETLKYPAVAAVSNPENAVSIRVLKKLGFKFQKKITTKPRHSPDEIELDFFEARPGTDS